MADLSPRQREILDLVAAGRTSKEIAGELGISESTVNWHISNVFGRLGASSRAEAVALAIRDEPQPARRPSVPPSAPLLSIGVVALALLLGLLGGVMIAGWQVTQTPSSTAVPAGTAAPTVTPTARPSGALAPRPEAESAAPAAMPSPPPRMPALASIAPVLGQGSIQAPAPLQVPTTPTDLPTVPPLPAVAPLPTQLALPATLPSPSVP